VETVAKSEAILVKNKALSPAKTELVEQLRFRIRTVRAAAQYKYILLNAPDSALQNIAALLPGMKSPTILPLAEKGWSSMHSVVKEDEFWEIVDKLKAAGAEGILVCPIEKMVN
jgi:ATP phosphoribosyltransferase